MIFMADVKIKVEIFVPLTACGCSYSHFLDQVQKILQPYLSKIDFEMKNAESDEAEKLGIFANAVVLKNLPIIPNLKIYTQLHKLEIELPQYFKSN